MCRHFNAKNAAAMGTIRFDNSYISSISVTSPVKGGISKLHFMMMKGRLVCATVATFVGFYLADRLCR